MNGIGIQERYDDICEKSGLSEEIVRRVFRATRESIVSSLLKGERSTIPGIVSFTPEIRNKINPGGKSLTPYIKIKSGASTALETELAKQQCFYKQENNDDTGIELLNFVDEKNKKDGIITTQIAALL